jgi:hypothetical protein
MQVKIACTEYSHLILFHQPVKFLCRPDSVREYLHAQVPFTSCAFIDDPKTENIEYQ